MRDVSAKVKSLRRATARGNIHLLPITVDLVATNTGPKQDVIQVARTAAIMAAKQTYQLIPYCQPVMIDWVGVDITCGDGVISVEATVKAVDRTGVEMEALTAASVCLLTIYDMLKPVDDSMVIDQIQLVEKTGGKSDFAEEIEPFKAAAITVSDSVTAGTRIDRTGPLLSSAMREAGALLVEECAVPDDQVAIQNLVSRLVAEKCELILLTGGTGLAIRDVTPEALEGMWEKRLEGVEAAIHSYGQERFRHAMLGRVRAGVIGGSLVVCLPGSVGAVKDGIVVLIPPILHGLEILRGGQHQS